MTKSIDLEKPEAVNSIDTLDTGLGTTYERWALNRVLIRIVQEKGIKQVLEGPGDGMTGVSGINSLALCMRGLQVTLVLPNEARAEFARKVWSKYLPGDSGRYQILEKNQLPLMDKAFDLVWNFNVMTRTANLRTQLEEMVRVSRRYVLIFVPNCQNYSFPLHRFHHQRAHLEWDHGEVDLMRPEPWRNIFHEMGLITSETIWLDCPWWPDIVDMGTFVSDVFPFAQRWAKRLKPENRYAWPADELPYFDTKREPELAKAMQRLAYFENSSHPWIKKIFAHHVGILAERPSA